MNERRGVVEMQRAGLGDSFGTQHRVREFVTELGVGVGGEEIMGMAGS